MWLTLCSNINLENHDLVYNVNTRTDKWYIFILTVEVASFYQAKLPHEVLKRHLVKNLLAPKKSVRNVCRLHSYVWSRLSWRRIQRMLLFQLLTVTRTAILNSFLNCVINSINLCRPIEFAEIITRIAPPIQNQLNSWRFTSSLST